MTHTVSISLPDENMLAVDVLTCPRCGCVRLVSEFATDRTKRSGRKSWCRHCDSERSREYYGRNREKKIASVKAYQAPRKRMRLCAAACGRPALSSRHWYCEVCRVGRKGGGMAPKTSERGYGGQHQQLRKRWAREVALGGVACARCGLPIIPGEKWDLGHNDVDRSRYNGPEHARCNRGAAGRAGRWSSREW